MTIEEINDLAFKFVNDENPLNTMLPFFLENGGTLENVEYFGVFVKHWLDNHNGLKWADVTMDISFALEAARKEEELKKLQTLVP